MRRGWDGRTRCCVVRANMGGGEPSSQQSCPARGAEASSGRDDHAGLPVAGRRPVARSPASRTSVLPESSSAPPTAPRLVAACRALRRGRCRPFNARHQDGRASSRDTVAGAATAGLADAGFDVGHRVAELLGVGLLGEVLALLEGESGSGWDQGLRRLGAGRRGWTNREPARDCVALRVGRTVRLAGGASIARRRVGRGTAAARCCRGRVRMRLEHLYRVRFAYPQGWAVELEGGWQQHLYLAECSRPTS